MRTLYSFITLLSLAIVVFVVSRLEPPKTEPPAAALYQKECGACHWAVFPGLLHAQSWKKLLSGLEDHFGYDALLEPEDQIIIHDYLVKNGSNSEIQEKGIPIRITKLLDVRREHQLIKPWLDPNIHFMNCANCHVRADEGVFKQIAFNRVNRLKAGAKTSSVKTKN